MSPNILCSPLYCIISCLTPANMHVLCLVQDAHNLKRLGFDPHSAPPLGRPVLSAGKPRAARQG